VRGRRLNPLTNWPYSFVSFVLDFCCFPQPTSLVYNTFLQNASTFFLFLKKIFTLFFDNFLTEKSIDDMIDTKRNGIKKYKEEEYGLQKKEKFDMEGRILSFCCGAAGFWRDLCGDPHRGADPEAGQCTAS
ncbi:hypothetical protein, partial [Blautia sp.]|uniref:hypothetical protein n=1 Tax=Blautia sp. TaxID=1955243 RepID=UPI003AB80667